jgi:hypothetical protein
MTVRHTSPADRLRLHKLCFGLLLPLLLLLAQQGAVLHELGHHISPAGHETFGDTAHGGLEACDLCLGFAQLGSTATMASARTPLLAALSFHLAPAALPTFRAAEAPALHSRGPPASI